MAKLEHLGTVIDADILVIGGGSAALWAANRAKDNVDNVLIVDKGPLQWGGLISMSGGDFDANGAVVFGWVFVVNDSLFDDDVDAVDGVDHGAKAIKIDA